MILTSVVFLQSISHPTINLRTLPQHLEFSPPNFSDSKAAGVYHGAETLHLGCNFHLRCSYSQMVTEPKVAVNRVQMDNTAFLPFKHIATTCRVKVKPRKVTCATEIRSSVIIILLLTDSSVKSSGTPTAPNTSSGSNVKLFMFLYGYNDSTSIYLYVAGKSLMIPTAVGLLIVTASLFLSII